MMFWKNKPKPLSPSTEALLDSFQNHPEKWSVGKNANGMDMEKTWHFSGTKGLLIYCGDNSQDTKYYTLPNSTKYEATGFEIILPYSETFPYSEQKMLIAACSEMISRKNSSILEETGLSYTDLETLIEELIKANKAYSLTSPNITLRKWAERIKDKV